LALSLAAVGRAAEPGYEVVVASGTVAKTDMGKTVAFAPDEGGKPGKQVTLDVTPDTVLLEATAGKGAPAVKPVKAADLKAGAKQPVAVVYARVGDANHLLALAAHGDAKPPKGFVVDGVRGVLNKVDGGKAVTMQPLIDGKFGKQQDVGVLPGSRFLEMAPKDDPKRPYAVTAAKVADLTAKRQAVAVLFARQDDKPVVLALVAQPGKEK
jgi:hypothetical protein